MDEIESYEHTDATGNHIEVILYTDKGRWGVQCWVNDESSWDVTHNPELESERSRMPFTEEEARKEFDRWRPIGTQNNIRAAVEASKDEPAEIEQNDFDLPQELVSHIGHLIHQVVLDDPTFLEHVSPHADKSWDPAKVLHDWATRAILRGVAEALI